MDRELALLNKRHELCHEDDTLWRRGLTSEGNMPDEREMVMVSQASDASRSSGPAEPAQNRRGLRSDLLSDRRVAITTQMKIHNCKRPKGSKEAQEIRYRRTIASYQCAL